MEELFDTYNLNGDFLGIKTKSFCHSKNPGVYHKPVWIWIINKNNEILIQKRAMCKKNQPGLWDTSVAGHAHAGEDLISACVREAFEEIGILIDESKFEFISEYILQEEWEIAQIYLVKEDIKLNDLVLDSKEVGEVRYVKFDELKEIINSNKFVSYPNEYKEYILNRIKGTYSLETRMNLFINNKNVFN